MGVGLTRRIVGRGWRVSPPKMEIGKSHLGALEDIFYLDRPHRYRLCLSMDTAGRKIYTRVMSADEDPIATETHR